MILEHLSDLNVSWDLTDKIEEHIFGHDTCVLKQCCEKFRKKQKYCKKCPRK